MAKASQQPLTVEALLNELALLTSAEIIPPNQLLTIIAKSHVALTTQLVEFQARQTEENSELRRTLLDLNARIEQQLSPEQLTRNLLIHNHMKVALWGMILPGVILLTILATHLSQLRATWAQFAATEASLYVTLSLITVVLGGGLYIVYRLLTDSPPRQ